MISLSSSFLSNNNTWKKCTLFAITKARISDLEDLLCPGLASLASQPQLIAGVKQISLAGEKKKQNKYKVLRYCMK